MADPAILNEKIQNDTMLRALRGEPVDHVPVWLMRQAGRYLPEFRKLRESHDFFTMCTTPSLVSETTLQPLERFPIDAVVLFSDILVIPQALGFEVKMEPNVGPVFPKPLPNPDELQTRVLDVSHDTCRTHLQYVYDGIMETRRNLRGRVPLIGFAGAPWTLMCYMIDGSGSEKSKGKFAQAINWLYMHPEAAHKLLDKLAREIAAHLVEQVRHGAHLVQLFDTWAGLIPPHLYAEFGLPYLKLTLELFRAEIKDAPAICFAKGAFFALDQLSKLGFNALSLDWTIDPTWAREQVGGRCGLQGNLDPLCLHASKDKIRSEVKAMLTKFNHSSTGLKHYVANLGHGCLPTFDPEHVGCFVDAVHEFSKEIIASSKPIIRISDDEITWQVIGSHPFLFLG